MLIYACYGVWHSTLELDAQEQRAHASSYRRYDDHLDDAFSPDDSFHRQGRDEGPYQGWSAPEERGYNYRQQNQRDDRDGERRQSQDEGHGDHYGYQSGPGSQSRGWTGGRTNHGFGVSDEED